MLTRVHESFQEGGIAQQPSQTLLQDLNVLQRALEQEVAEELRGCCVAEKGEIKAACIAEQCTQFLIVPCCSCGSHCKTDNLLAYRFRNASIWSSAKSWTDADPISGVQGKIS